MASMAAFVYFWSSAYEVSGCCTTDTLYPSFLRMLATALQPEPSAKAPCTRTTFLICSFMIILLFPLVSFRSSHQTCKCCPENPTPTHNAVRLPPLTTRSILQLIVGVSMCLTRIHGQCLKSTLS